MTQMGWTLGQIPLRGEPEMSEAGDAVPLLKTPCRPHVPQLHPPLKQAIKGISHLLNDRYHPYTEQSLTVRRPVHHTWPFP